MSVLEQEIIEKVKLLEPPAKQRVLQTLSSDIQSTFDYKSWWRQVESLQASMKANLDQGETIGALSLLDELREDES
jgi:hypothetical protein